MTALTGRWGIWVGKGSSKPLRELLWQQHMAVYKFTPAEELKTDYIPQPYTCTHTQSDGGREGGRGEGRGKGGGEREEEGGREGGRGGGRGGEREGRRELERERERVPAEHMRCL